jgi:hypothetical protein
MMLILLTCDDQKIIRINIYGTPYISRMISGAISASCFNCKEIAFSFFRFLGDSVRFFRWDWPCWVALISRIWHTPRFWIRASLLSPSAVLLLACFWPSDSLPHVRAGLPTPFSQSSTIRGCCQYAGFTYQRDEHGMHTLGFDEAKARSLPGFREVWDINFPIEGLSARRQSSRWGYLNPERFSNWRYWSSHLNGIVW